LPDLPLPFLKPLRARHIELAHGWARAVDEIAGVRDERAQGEAEYRQRVRDAVAQQAPVPPRPESLDLAVVDARVSVALEDSQIVRDDLAEHVLEVLAQLRAHRAEITPHLATFGPDLLGALSIGPGNQKAILVERVRRELAALQADAAIEVFDDDHAPVHTPELMKVGANA